MFASAYGGSASHSDDWSQQSIERLQDEQEQVVDEPPQALNPELEMIREKIVTSSLLKNERALEPNFA